MTRTVSPTAANDFIAAYKALALSSPQISVSSRNVENCPYGDQIYNCNNCYLCFETGGSSDGTTSTTA